MGSAAQPRVQLTLLRYATDADRWTARRGQRLSPIIAQQAP